MNLGNLTQFQKDELLHYFLHTMGMATRGHVMSHYPVSYGKLFPHISEELIADEVKRTIELIR